MMISEKFLSYLVIKPIRLAHLAFGNRIWPPLEQLAAVVGHIAGTLAAPILNHRYAREHSLSPIMHFVDIVEGSLGVQGDHEIIDAHKAKKVVHACPYAQELQSISEFCTRLGCIAGQKAFNRINPAVEYEIRSTISQGDSCCEYVYRLQSQ